MQVFDALMRSNHENSIVYDRVFQRSSATELARKRTGMRERRIGTTGPDFCRSTSRPRGYQIASVRLSNYSDATFSRPSFSMLNGRVRCRFRAKEHIQTSASRACTCYRNTQRSICDGQTRKSQHSSVHVADVQRSLYIARTGF